MSTTDTREPCALWGEALKALYVEGVQAGIERAVEALDCDRSAALVANAKHDAAREAAAFFDEQWPDSDWPVLAALTRPAPPPAAPMTWPDPAGNDRLRNSVFRAWGGMKRKLAGVLANADNVGARR